MELIITNKEEFENRPRLPEDIKDEWLLALKSGGYKKGKGVLCKDEKYCCLGVLCEISKLEKIMPFTDISSTLKGYQVPGGTHWATRFLPEGFYLTNLIGNDGRFVGFYIGSDKTLYPDLTGLNDATKTFDEVIEVIEKYF